MFENDCDLPDGGPNTSVAREVFTSALYRECNLVQDRIQLHWRLAFTLHSGV